MRQQILQDWLVLFSLPALGRALITKLVDEFGSPSLVLAASFHLLSRVNGIGPHIAGILTDSRTIEKARAQACRELDNLRRSNIDVLLIGDDDYPAPLANIPDPPCLLYVKGQLKFLQQKAVAVIGSRSATSYGRRVSFTLAGELAERGVCVVSGMALGVDAQAHKGALTAGGATIGVLGCGIDVVYPRQHGELFAAVEEKGLVVSEYPMGTRPDGFRFPERNRIISGLVQGVVVVEATRKSGSLITARLALEQGRDVFAIPGRIDSPKSQGTHYLIQQGARLVQGVDDIIDEFVLTETSAGYPFPVAREGSCGQELIDEGEKRLLACLDVYPVDIDELVRASGYGSADVSDMLVRLELKGIVRQLPGQQYELCCPEFGL